MTITFITTPFKKLLSNQHPARQAKEYILQLDVLQHIEADSSSRNLISGFHNGRFKIGL
jgi:hypothetical protein